MPLYNLPGDDHELVDLLIWRSLVAIPNQLFQIFQPSRILLRYITQQCKNNYCIAAAAANTFTILSYAVKQNVINKNNGAKFRGQYVENLKHQFQFLFQFLLKWAIRNTSVL